MRIYPYYYLRSYKKPSKSQQGKKNNRNLLGNLVTGVGAFVFFGLLVYPLVSDLYFSSNFAPMVKGVGEDFESLQIKDTSALKMVVVALSPLSGVVLGDSDSTKLDNNYTKTFQLSIPKLSILNAKVLANSTSLDPSNNLIHVFGSAFPGSTGNVFITGHSTFKYLYKPEDYNTIFSTLSDLKTDDKIYISVNDKKLTYKVFQKEIVKPEDVDVKKDISPTF